MEQSPSSVDPFFQADTSNFNNNDSLIQENIADAMMENDVVNHRYIGIGVILYVENNKSILGM